MDKNQLLIELEKNIKEFRELENKNASIMAAIYEKSIEELKNKKIAEVKKYFSNQVNYYGQDMYNYKDEIGSIIKEYTNQINNLKQAYDYLYINTFKKMQDAINNQIIAMGNIVTLWNKREKSENLVSINNKMTAVLQKKVNYSVIIEECKARLNWCIENVQNDINVIFVNDFYQLEVYKDGFFDKLKRKILNIIQGKRKFSEVINKYKEENLKEISDNNKLKVVDVIATAKGVFKQIKNVNDQISVQYENSIQKA